ncbi:MAG TPA: type VI secretion system tip protein TssI/VgrG, partial [Pyrinomonadaceae bacterium]|nr:type VI secretion system tip protein TssI/VgrG [Pyrinomonadaceae bacterium]
RPGKYTVTDFNFETPMLDLTAQVTGRDERQFEVYDFPGEYETKDDGERLAGIRMHEEESPRVVVTGAGTCRAFTPGYKFDLREHYRRDLNKPYTLLSVYHSCDHGMNFRSGDGAGADFSYVNQFQCIPHPDPFRPPRTAPVPVVHGTQTAIVVGPKGEEIYADKYGRVKVQFHWDRMGKYDEKSSCWVRVSQNWAGKRWGAMFLPRIGQEVIVDFLEGDPDRPIITGRVYNAASMPPYALPGEKTKSTVKTNSSKGGGGFNELRFEDKKGAEQIFIHAERDEDVRIKNDRREWVGRDTHLIVKRDQLEKVEGDKHLTVTGDRNEKVGGTVSLKAGQDVQEKVGAKYGRVKVQFHWDREGKLDDKSSCWIRVSQNWAGKRWGAMFIPRIGQEVIVDFIEGDPDRPIITGRVYNGGSMPPYALPGEKTKSTIKSYSSKGGGGFNEIRFEDAKGSEQIFVHAEKDEDKRVKNDRKEWVGRDRHLIVKRDKLEKVEGDKHLQVTGDKNEKVGGGVSLKVGMDVNEKVGTKFALQAGTEIHLKAGMNAVIEAGMSITLKAGGGFVVIGPTGVTISGTPVLINSGGAAGSGSGSSPQTPKNPLEADKAEPGQKPELPKPKRPPKPATYSPSALVMKQAAQNGTPFCEICNQ